MSYTEADVKPLVDAVRDFIKKVETGEAKSKRSYIKFKEALAYLTRDGYTCKNCRDEGCSECP